MGFRGGYSILDANGVAVGVVELARAAELFDAGVSISPVFGLDVEPGAPSPARRTLVGFNLTIEPAVETLPDWTCDDEGYTNGSEAFMTICAAVEKLIRDDAGHLIAGRADITARMIVGQLAHVHGLAPTVARVDS